MQTRRTPRTAGILLHPTSLPGPFGIGDLGPQARLWVRQLARARQSWWQVLPLGPTGYADSPYQSLSAFAGNPNLLSPELLVADGLLRPADLDGVRFGDGPVDYAAIIPFKRLLLRRAWENLANADAALRADYERFVREEAHWLDDFVRFVAFKEAHQGRPWWEWPREAAFRDPAALRSADVEWRDALETQRLAQFLFFRQWQALRADAHSHGVRLLGDLPIFMALDSADLWAHPELFQLDTQRRPTVVAGVPPDYFSETGQLWGNPLYDWTALRRTGFAWWVDRLRATLRLVDLVRLDHFRGFQAYWEVPAGATTAVGGRWVHGPGEELLSALRAALGELPIIAEDLGFITPEVDALRERFGLPGMRILQFAFGGAVEDRFLPHNLERNVIVYTGTHDNDTTLGWYASLTDRERAHFHQYLPGADRDPAWTLVRLAWMSVADCAVAPLQDVLRLGDEARMNRPGTASGNWRWRASAEQLAADWPERLAGLTEVYQRQSPSPGAG
jgi:4-alpha-glucanotransferase